MLTPFLSYGLPFRFFSPHFLTDLFFCYISSSHSIIKALCGLQQSYPCVKYFQITSYHCFTLSGITCLCKDIYYVYFKLIFCLASFCNGMQVFFFFKQMFFHTFKNQFSEPLTSFTCDLFAAYVLGKKTTGFPVSRMFFAWAQTRSSVFLTCHVQCPSHRSMGGGRGPPLLFIQPLFFSVWLTSDSHSLTRGLNLMLKKGFFRVPLIGFETYFKN